jgi:hypothetical protein
MQLLAGVPVLHNLGLPMVCYRASDTDVPGFLWCGCNLIVQMGYPAHRRAIGFFFTAFLSWSGPYLTSISSLP